MCVQRLHLVENTMERLSYAEIQSNYSGSTPRNKHTKLNVKSPLTSDEYHVEYNAKVYNSASKVLEQYIKDHEHKEAVSLTKSLTRGHSKHAILNLQNDRGKPNTPDREIKMARSLFSEEYTNSLKEFDASSICTDDLLLESLNITKELNMKNSNPVPSYKTYSKAYERGNKVVTSTPAKSSPIKEAFGYKPKNQTEETDYGLYSLNGVNYTPHTLKYKKSQISPYKWQISELNNQLSAKHRIKSSLSVSSIDKNDKTGSSILNTQSQLENNQDKQTRALSPTPTDLLIENIVQDYRDRTAVHNYQTTLPKPDLNGAAITTPYSSQRQHKAGRTPYKNPEYDFYDRVEDDETLCESLSQELNTSDSKSHISVSLHLEGKPTDVKDFMEDCLNSNNKSFNNQQQHKTGTVESLKNMLFTLQGLQTKQEMYQENQSNEVEQEIDGHSSLQKAILHLNNLSSL